MSEKPLLLLDVDGPLNPYAAPNLPSGYQVHEFPMREVAGILRVRLHPGHGKMIRELMDLTEPVWCTAWNGLANQHIAPLIDLPPLPVIDVGRPQWPVDGHIWKLKHVIEYAGDRPLAWFDDDFTHDDLSWAAHRALDGTPTLLRMIDPAVGLLKSDIARVAMWAGKLAARGR